MYEKDLVKQGINLTWILKALLQYALVEAEYESCPIFLLYFCHYSCTWQVQILVCYYLYVTPFFNCA